VTSIAVSSKRQPSGWHHASVADKTVRASGGPRLGAGALAIAAVSPGKLDDVGGQPLLVIAALRRLALRRAVLIERRTGPTLGNAKNTTNMLDTGVPTRRAQ